jgi:hypothetical protein
MRKPKYILLSVLTSALFLSACQTDDDCEPEAEQGNLRLTYAAVFDGTPITDAGVYTNIEGYRLDLSQLRAYIGDLSLVSGTSSSIVSRIELVNLLNGEQTRTYQLSPGSYTGMKFGIGVPSDLNNTDPVTFGPDHPLYLQNGTYWNWTQGYRFVLFEGIADTTGTGSGAFDLIFSMHPGLDTAYREVDYVAPITISDNSTTDIRVEFDVSEFFYGTSDTLRLKTENQLHGNNSYLNTKLADFIKESVTVTQ